MLKNLFLALLKSISTVWPGRKKINNASPEKFKKPHEWQIEWFIKLFIWGQRIKSPTRESEIYIFSFSILFVNSRAIVAWGWVFTSTLSSFNYTITIFSHKVMKCCRNNENLSASHLFIFSLLFSREFFSVRLNFFFESFVVVDVVEFSLNFNLLLSLTAVNLFMQHKTKAKISDYVKKSLCMLVFRRLVS